MITALALVLCMPAAVAGQTSAPAPPPVSAATPVDPARLAAARALIDVLMPPATRTQLIEGMIAPMQANMRRGLEDSAEFKSAMGRTPQARAIFDRLMAKQEARTNATLRAGLPGMVQAMASAYARRFTVAQMAELRAFFETPTGRTYMQASYTIMSDPDIQAWQRQLMTATVGSMQADITEMMAEIETLPPGAP